MKTAKKYFCDREGCDKFYFDKTSLSNHINGHDGIKRFQC